MFPGDKIVPVCGGPLIIDGYIPGKLKLEFWGSGVGEYQKKTPISVSLSVILKDKRCHLDSGDYK